MDYHLRMHDERELVSFRWTDADTFTPNAPDCSFQIGTDILGDLCDYLRTPVEWSWRTAVNGWFRLPDATVLTVTEVCWRWHAAVDGSNHLQIVAEVLDHGFPSRPGADSAVLVTALTPAHIDPLRVTLNGMTGR